MGRIDSFDPNNITKENMQYLADHIENHVNYFESIMIIPDEIRDECEKHINEGIKRTKKLIKKLRKGDRSVFKDTDEWNSIF